MCLQLLKFVKNHRSLSWSCLLVFDIVTLCICYVMHCQILTEIFKSHKLPVDRKQELKLSFEAIQQAKTTRKKRKWFHWTIKLLFIFVRHWKKVCCIVPGLLQIFYTPFSLRYEPFRATHEREFSCPLNFNFHIAGGLQLHFVSVYQLVRRIQVKIGFLLRPFESDPAISNGWIGGS